MRSGTSVWDVQDVNGGDNRLGGVWGQYSRWLIEGGIAPGHGELRAGADYIFLRSGRRHLARLPI